MNTSSAVFDEVITFMIFRENGSGDVAESEESLNAARPSVTTQKRTLTASDVEPLRQLLNKRRGIRE